MAKEKKIYRNNYNYGQVGVFHSKPEELGGKNPVEVHGVLDPKEEIERLLLAGARLDVSRMELFDAGPDEEIPDDFIDVTRDPDFDLADFHAFITYLRERSMGEANAKATVDNPDKKHPDSDVPPVEEAPDEPPPEPVVDPPA